MLKILPVKTNEDKEAAKALSFELNRLLKTKLPQYEDLSAENRKPMPQIWIANYKCVNVGCIGLRGESDKVCEMVMLYVKEDSRGEGIGRKLCNNIIEYAKQLGYHYLRLVTYEPLDAALKLYESLGFEKINAYTKVPPELKKMAVFMELKLV